MKKLDKLVRDLTKVHPIPKSKVREMIEEYVKELKEEIKEQADIIENL